MKRFSSLFLAVACLATLAPAPSRAADLDFYLHIDKVDEEAAIPPTVAFEADSSVVWIAETQAAAGELSTWQSYEPFSTKWKMPTMDGKGSEVSAEYDVVSVRSLRLPTTDPGDRVPGVVTLIVLPRDDDGATAGESMAFETLIPLGELELGLVAVDEKGAPVAKPAGYLHYTLERCFVKSWSVSFDGEPIVELVIEFDAGELEYTYADMTGFQLQTFAGRDRAQCGWDLPECWPNEWKAF